FSLPGDTTSSGSKVRFFSSTPISFLGRSMMCPTEASTSKPLPRYFSIVFALAGDSTITSDLFIAILKPNPTLYCSICWTHNSELPFSSQGSRNSVRLRPFSPSGKKLPANVAPYHVTPLRFHLLTIIFFSRCSISRTHNPLRGAKIHAKKLPYRRKNLLSEG